MSFGREPGWKICPSYWVRCWEGLVDDHSYRAELPVRLIKGASPHRWLRSDLQPSSTKISQRKGGWPGEIERLKMCNEERFAVYVSLHCFRHCQKLAQLPGDATKLSSDLADTLLQDGSAFRGWASYVVMLDPATVMRKRRWRRGDLILLKEQVAEILQSRVVKGDDHLQPSPLFTLTRWDLFSCLNSPLDYEEVLRLKCQASAKPSETNRRPLSTSHFKAGGPLPAQFFTELYSKNIFDQTALPRRCLQRPAGSYRTFTPGQKRRNYRQSTYISLYEESFQFECTALGRKFRRGVC